MLRYLPTSALFKGEIDLLPLMDAFKIRTLQRKNVRGLTLSSLKPKVLAPPTGYAKIVRAIRNDEGRADTLETRVEFRLDLNAKDVKVGDSKDLVWLKQLHAEGSGVAKVKHRTTGVIMVRKVR